MKKYKILLVVRHPVGGIRTFFRYFYRNFNIKQYAFTLISPDLPETKKLLNDLSILDLKYVLTKQDISNKDFFQTVTKIIRSENFDLIHSHGFICGVSAVFGSVLKRIPHILTLHETLTNEHFVKLGGSFGKIVLSLMLTMIDAIHCVSYDARDNLLVYLKILRFFKDKLIVILPGIEVERFLNPERKNLRMDLDLPEDAFLIGFLGRHMPEKGFRFLVDALEHLNNKIKELKKISTVLKTPVILSFNQEDGFIREEKENVKMKGLSNQIIFLPFVENVASTLKGLDVVVMPSLREAGTLLALETMVSGTPLIGTNCIGLREMIKNTPATVVPAGDSLALSEALLKEMQNSSTIKAKAFVEEAAIRYEAKRQAQELEKLILKYLLK